MYSVFKLGKHKHHSFEIGSQGQMLSLVTSRLTSSGSGGCVHKTEKMVGSFFVMVFLLVVMATLILESGSVERNPGPVGKSNSIQVAKILQK